MLEIMEHRWGERTTLDRPIRIDCRSQATAVAVLRDASVSGAFLCTSARLALLTTVEITLLGRGRTTESIEALVVRSAPDGFGLEWAEIAPRAIVDLLSAPLRIAADAVDSQPLWESSAVVDPPSPARSRATPASLSAASPQPVAGRRPFR